MKTIRFACIIRCGAILAAIAAISTPMSSAKAGTISQIPAGFSVSSVELYMGFPSGQSQFDANPDSLVGDVSNFATIYDNFTFGSNLSVTNFSWIGIYEDDPTTSIGADSFTVRIFSDVGGQPGGTLASANVGMANETAIDSTIFSYSADISPFTVIAGQQYWFSVVANMNADDPPLATDPGVNEWGVAFSAIGDGESFQDFQTGPGLPGIERFNDPVDYAFSVTAVPEPATGLALLMLGGGAAAYRRVRRRSETTPVDAAV